MMLFLIIWALLIVGMIVLLERNGKEAFYEYCKLECGDEFVKPSMNRPDRYMY